MHGRAARCRSYHLQAVGSPAQRRMVGHREIETEQADDGPDQPFSLAERQAEHGAQGQRRGDGQGGVVRLAAGGGAPLGTPGGDRGLGEPDRQAAAPAQGGVICRPIRDLVSLLRDVVAALLVCFEGHAGFQWLRGGGPPNRPRPCRQPSVRATRSLGCEQSQFAALEASRLTVEVVDEGDAARHQPFVRVVVVDLEIAAVRGGGKLHFQPPDRERRDAQPLTDAVRVGEQPLLE